MNLDLEVRKKKKRERRERERERERKREREGFFDIFFAGCEQKEKRKNQIQIITPIHLFRQKRKIKEKIEIIV